jgi:hypothetical protein
VEAKLEKLEHDITATGKAGTLDAVCAFVLFNSQVSFKASYTSSLRPQRLGA